MGVFLQRLFERYVCNQWSEIRLIDGSPIVVRLIGRNSDREADEEGKGTRGGGRNTKLMAFLDDQCRVIVLKLLEGRSYERGMSQECSLREQKASLLAKDLTAAHRAGYSKSEAGS
jgi:hypothetical protein